MLKSIKYKINASKTITHSTLLFLDSLKFKYYTDLQNYVPVSNLFLLSNE